MVKKVQFGLKNAKYAKILSYDETAGYTYDVPKAIGCSVTMSISQVGDQSKFYCDDNVSYTTTSNQGYEGSLEVSQISDDFRIDILGDIADDNNVLVEYNNTIPSSFALLYEVDGVDESDTQLQTAFVFYNSKATRPGFDHNTKTDTVEPDTMTLEFTADPRADNLVKAFVNSDETPYATWFDTVYEPVITPVI